MDRLGVGMVAALAAAVLLAGIAGWKYLADGPSAGEQVAALADRLRSRSSNAPPSQADASTRRPESDAPAAGAPPVEGAGNAPADAIPRASAPDAAARVDGSGSPRSASSPRATQVQPPVFDLVRVDENGHVVLAGRAQPGSTVVVLVDGNAIGMASVDDQGAWTFDTDDEPPLRDMHQLTVRLEDAEGNVLARSPQTVTVSMRPARAGGVPLVVLASPDAPSRVLQQPATSRLARAATAPEEQRSAASPGAAMSEEGMEARLASLRRQARAARGAGAEELARAVRLMRQGDGKAAQGERRSAASAATEGHEQAAASTPPTAAVASPSSSSEQGQQPPLALRTVDYDADGAIFFTGSSAAGAALRLYVNNRHLGDVRADEAGNWQWRGRTDIAPGRHALRIDRLAADGRVLERIELPFVRVDARRIAEARGATDGSAPRQGQRQPTGATGEEEAPSVRDTATAGMPAVDNPPTARQPRMASPPSGEEAGAGAGNAEAMQSLPGGGPARAGIAAPATAGGQDLAPAAADPRLAEKGFIVVQPGNNLWNIARVIYGKGVRYTTIYEANRDRIRNPHRIYPGQVFAAPGVPAKQLSIDPRRRRPATPEELRKSDVLH